MYTVTLHKGSLVGALALTTRENSTGFVYCILKWLNLPNFLSAAMAAGAWKAKRAARMEHSESILLIDPRHTFPNTACRLTGAYINSTCSLIKWIPGGHETYGKSQSVDEVAEEWCCYLHTTRIRGRLQHREQQPSGAAPPWLLTSRVHTSTRRNLFHQATLLPVEGLLLEDWNINKWQQRHK